MRAFWTLGALIACAIPAIASAQVGGFATFQAVNGTNYNIAYNRNTKTLYTTSNATASSIGTPGGVLVNFDYLQSNALFNSMGVVRGIFTLSALSTGNASMNEDTGTDSQGRFGSAASPSGFTIKSATTFTANGKIFAAGTNLLSGTFTNATLSAEDGDTAGSFRDSTPGTGTLPKAITYTSDFLDFSGTLNRSFSMSLEALSPRASVTGNSFDSFSGIVGGTFSSDPPPNLTEPDPIGYVPSGVPEPATWLTMLVGFGLVGHALRRRRTGLLTA